MDSQLTHDYLNRIGIATGRGPDAEFLKELQERHLMTVPFENIDFHLAEPIRLGSDAIDKVVRRRRGGTCRELNGSAFSTLLASLGYTVTLLGSRVFIEDRPSFALAHTVIRVDCPGPWLVDVGFGRDGARYPLRLDTRAPQTDPYGTFEFAEAPDGDLDLIRDGKTVLRIESQPRRIDDFRPVLWWFESSPDSPFRDNLFCTRATEGGRITLRGNLLTRTEGSHREKLVLGDDTEIEQAYKEHFDITLDRLPPIPGCANR
jgi:N-hydroxyarylamine O-acetyltransferase